jgi:hypothetical protein
MADNLPRNGIGVSPWCDQEGAVSGIHSVAQHLKAHYPSTGPNRDELPDVPVVL